MRDYRMVFYVEPRNTKVDYAVVCHDISLNGRGKDTKTV
jgi:hypothetical protein